MRLAEYLKKYGLSDAEFAKRAGIDRIAVWRYRTGRGRPRADKLAAIEELTKRQVTAADFTV